MPNISFFSDIELQQFTHDFAKPFADHFLSFNGKKMVYVKDDKEMGGYRVKAESLSWQNTLAKVGLFVLALLTVIPAIVFSIQKISYRAQISKVLADTSQTWARCRDAFTKVHLEFPHIVTEQAIKTWYSQDTQKIKTALRAEEKCDQKTLVDFYRTFASKDDFVTISNGDKTWKINHNLAAIRSEYFQTAFSANLREQREGKIEIKNPDNKPYSNEVFKILADYLNEGTLHSIAPAQAKELYVLAHQLKMGDLLDAARKVFVSMYTIDKDNLLEIWNWADTYDEAGIQLQCADFYKSSPKKEYPGHLFETLQLSAIAETLRKLGATYRQGTLSIRFFDQEALDELEAGLKMHGIETLDFSSCTSKSASITWLQKILQEPSCSVTGLNLQCSNSSSLNVDEIKKLLQAINIQQKVKNVNLNHSRLCDAGIEILLPELALNHSIESLTLINSSIHQQTIPLLTYAFKKESPIRSLVLYESRWSTSHRYNDWPQIKKSLKELSKGEIDLSEHVRLIPLHVKISK